MSPSNNDYWVGAHVVPDASVDTEQRSRLHLEGQKETKTTQTQHAPTALGYLLRFVSYRDR